MTCPKSHGEEVVKVGSLPMSVCLRHSQSLLSGPNSTAFGLTKPLTAVSVVFRNSSPRAQVMCLQGQATVGLVLMDAILAHFTVSHSLPSDQSRESFQWALWHC